MLVLTIFNNNAFEIQVADGHTLNAYIGQIYLKNRK